MRFLHAYLSNKRVTCVKLMQWQCLSVYLPTSQTNVKSRPPTDLENRIEINQNTLIKLTNTYIMGRLIQICFSCSKWVILVYCVTLCFGIRETSDMVQNIETVHDEIPLEQSSVYVDHYVKVLQKLSRARRSTEQNSTSSETSDNTQNVTNSTTPSISSTESSNVNVSEIGPSDSSLLTVVHVNASTSSVPNVSAANPSDAAPLPGKSSAEDEHNSSMSIFFVLCILALGILLIHLMLQTGFSYLPESIVIVFLGALIGMIINLMSIRNIANWRKEEAFSPTAFFLVLLPPIIFESGYNLHKGNFFQNIGSILLFAIVGTAISAFVIGAGIYLLGLAQVVYKLSFVESFAFGSLISAVDPVATVAIFQALDVDPVLNMLVFGESILNDAVSIVLTTAVLQPDDSIMTTGEAILSAINRFWLMFFASAGIGVLFALVSALLLKHVDLRKHPSLEFGMMLVFTYAPYVLAEGIHLSGE